MPTDSDRQRLYKVLTGYSSEQLENLIRDCQKRVAKAEDNGNSTDRALAIEAATIINAVLMRKKYNG